MTPLPDNLLYQAPLWLPGGHLQTIWAAKCARNVRDAQPSFQRERWHTPDKDFVDVDWIRASSAVTTQPLLVLFHGLEGSSKSHYARAFAAFAESHGYSYAVPHFRGCSGEPNWTPRAYHSGDYEEIEWILRTLRGVHNGPIVAVGVSLGGNALLRWAQESGTCASALVSALAAICAPVDLAAGGWAMGKGFNRAVYTRMFLNTMVPKALEKATRFPGTMDHARLMKVRTLYEFDNVFTAPLHGFRDTLDYWDRASSAPHMHRIQVPALVVNALNDPFVPASSLPKAETVGRYVQLWQPEHGGHVGFPTGNFPGHVHAIPDLVGRWLTRHIHAR